MAATAEPLAGPAPGAPATGEAVRRSFKGGSLNLLGSLVSAAAGFAVVMAVTNSLGAAGAGLFIAATNTALLAANVLKLGAEQGSVYAVAGTPAGDRDARWAAVAVAVVPPLAVSVAVSVLLVAFAGPVAAWVLGDASHAALVRVGALGVAPFVAGQILLGATRGLGVMGPTVRWGQVVRPLLQVAGVGTAVLLDASTTTLVVLWTAPLWAVPVGAAAALVHHLGPPALSRTGLPWRAFWRYTTPRAVADAAASALERIDIVLLSVMSGPVATSLYGAANRLANVPVTGMHALAQAAAPEIRAAHAASDRAAMVTLARSVTNTTVSLLWPVAVHMAVSGGTVLGLFGAEFGEAHAPLAVLAVGLGVAVTMGPGDMLVLMIGRSVRSLLNHLAAVVVDLLLIVLLVPAHGALGAAVAWAAAIVVMRILAVVEVWRAERVSAASRDGLVLAVVAAGSHLAAAGAALALLGPGWTAAVVGVAGGTALHASAIAGSPALRRAVDPRAASALPASA